MRESRIELVNRKRESDFMSSIESNRDGRGESEKLEQTAVERFM